MATADSVETRRSDPRRARTRGALVAAAQRLLAEGRTEVSIQEITDTAGVGFGSFYNHFEDKDELWTTAVAEALVAHGDLVAALSADLDDPAEVFCVGMRLTGRLQRSFPHLARVLLHTGMAPVITDKRGLMGRAYNDIKAAIEAGRFDIEDADLAVHFTAGSIIALLAFLDANPDVNAGEYTDEYAFRVLRAFGLSSRAARSLVARPLPDLTFAIGQA